MYSFYTIDELRFVSNNIGLRMKTRPVAMQFTGSTTGGLAFKPAAAFRVANISHKTATAVAHNHRDLHVITQHWFLHQGRDQQVTQKYKNK